MTTSCFEIWYRFFQINQCTFNHTFNLLFTNICIQLFFNANNLRSNNTFTVSCKIRIYNFLAPYCDHRCTPSSLGAVGACSYFTNTSLLKFIFPMPGWRMTWNSHSPIKNCTRHSDSHEYDLHPCQVLSLIIAWIKSINPVNLNWTGLYLGGRTVACATNFCVGRLTFQS